MNVIIVGCGRTGSLTAIMLDEAGHNVSVVDWSDTAFGRLGTNFKGSLIQGNAIEQTTLERAGAEHADVFVAATSGDNRNIMTSQVAKQIFGVPKVIARIKDPVRAEIYRDLGIRVDCRTLIGAQTLLDCLRLEE